MMTSGAVPLPAQAVAIHTDLGGYPSPERDPSSAGAEDARRLSEESFRLLFEGAPDAVFVEAFDGTVLDANPSACRLHGLTRAELVGTNVRALVPVEARQEAMERFSRMVTGEVTYLEGFSRRSDGTSLPVEVRVSRFAYGGVPALLLHVTDISARRATEERLRQEQEFSRLLVESSFDGIIALDRELRCTVWNPAMERMTGLEKAAMLGRPVLEVLPFLQERGEDAQMQAALRGEHTVSTDRPYRIEQTGREGFYEAQTSPMRSETGEIVGVVCVVRDTTDRKLVAKALRRSEERFAKAFQAAPVAMMVTRLGSGRVVDANDAFTRMSGYAPREVIGRTATDLGISVHRVLMDRVTDILQEGGSYGDVEARITTRGGATRDVISSGEFMEIGGEPCLLSMFYDITERKRLEREVLEIAEGERRRIGQDLHDGLGQQLTGIAFLTRILGRNLQEAAPDHVAQLQRVGELIAQAISYTRSLSRTLSPVDIPAAGLADALLRLGQSTREFSGVVCELDLDPLLHTASNTAATHLYRIAQEAVNNALKHAAPRCVSISLSSRDGKGVLRIADDGPGLSVSEADDSAGMGMRTMQYRANVIGGVLEVYAGKEGGTVVECRFPVGEGVSGIK